MQNGRRHDTVQGVVVRTGVTKSGSDYFVLWTPHINHSFVFRQDVKDSVWFETSIGDWRQYDVALVPTRGPEGIKSQAFNLQVPKDNSLNPCTTPDKPYTDVQKLRSVMTFVQHENTVKFRDKFTVRGSNSFIDGNFIKQARISSSDLRELIKFGIYEFEGVCVLDLVADSSASSPWTIKWYVFEAKELSFHGFCAKTGHLRHGRGGTLCAKEDAKVPPDALRLKAPSQPSRFANSTATAGTSAFIPASNPATSGSRFSICNAPPPTHAPNATANINYGFPVKSVTPSEPECLLPVLVHVPYLVFKPVIMLLLLSLLQSCLAAKILVYSPKFGFSHMNFVGSVADTLQSAGHNVTVFQPIMVAGIKSSGCQKAKVWEVAQTEDIKRAVAPFGGDELWKTIWGSSLYNPVGIIAPTPIMVDAFTSSIKNILSKPDLLEDLRREKFDLMVTELFDYGGFVLQHEIGIPTIVGVHTSILFDSTAHAMGIPVTPSFVPDSHGITGDDGSILTRLMRLFFGCFTSYFENGLIDGIQKFSDGHYHGKGPNIRKMIGDLPLIFTNSEPLLDFPRPIMSKVVDIGGIGLKPAKPLDEKWLKILSVRKANVLISFGSVAPSKTMPPAVKANIAEVAQRFPNVTFIWKYEEPEDGTGNGVDNLVLSPWTPQSDLLASGKIDLFVTHGGAGSAMESACNGVPTVVVPLFGDQMRNARMIERFGYGLVYNKMKLGDESSLTAAVQEGLYGTSLREKARLAQRMMKARPFSPQEQVIRYTALAAEFGSMPNLSPAGRNFTYVQYWNLDLLLMAVALVAVVLFGVVRVFKTCCSRRVHQRSPQVCIGLYDSRSADYLSQFAPPSHAIISVLFIGLHSNHRRLSQTSVLCPGHSSSMSMSVQPDHQSPAPPGYMPQQQVVYTQQPGLYPPLNNDANQQFADDQNLPASITVQPGVPPAPGTVVMPLPPQIEGVTPGLEYLTMVDSIFIQQMYDLLELVISWEVKNKYALKNANGQQVYYAAEESGICMRQCCGPQRGWTIHIVDNFKREVIRITRPFKCCGGCLSCLAFSACCAQEVTIESPAGNVIGTVKQRFTCCSSGFYVYDAQDTEIFKIEGPCCCLMCGCQDKEFPVKSTNGEQIGAVTKKWGGCVREAFTDADVFSVTFPRDLDVKMKAILLGATFLIDFMEFEQPKNKNHG